MACLKALKILSTAMVLWRHVHHYEQVALSRKHVLNKSLGRLVNVCPYVHMVVHVHNV